MPDEAVENEQREEHHLMFEVAMKALTYGSWYCGDIPTDRLSITEAVIRELRRLDVGERMTLMGMEKASGATVAGTTLDFYFQRPT